MVMRQSLYEDREAAGQVLAGMLQRHVAPPCVVAGIPRGGVLVADAIAERLGCPLTVSFARKLALPESPELAFGALDEDGHVVMDHSEFRRLAARPEELARARAAVTLEILRQQREFRVPRIDSFLPRCSVVLVDDGLATGYTMRAAIAHAWRHGARRITVAVPCASPSAAESIRREVDDLVCPWIDDEFRAVGAYYVHFPHVTGRQVRSVLDRACERRMSHVTQASAVSLGRP
jgi:predicted phosphoribosyltransferase